MDTRDLIKTFLRTMEARDLVAAEKMMAEGAKITFPGGRVFDTQREMVAAARGRYQWVKKAFDRMDTATISDGVAVVYILGTLYGVNRHGVAFSGIRFIDRFEIKHGLITAQDVWNDLAESGVLEQPFEGENG